MANPTTNYGFVLPTPTDLVTDLPADFDVALQGVDTRLKALQPGTTLGDLAYSSATANTNTRLAIGSTGNILTVAGGVPTWAAPAASGGMTLIGATATDGVSNINFTSLAQTYKHLLLVWTGVAAASPGQISLRANADTSNYIGGLLRVRATTVSGETSTNFGDFNGQSIDISTTANAKNAGALWIYDYASTTQAKFGKTTAYGYSSNFSQQQYYEFGAYYNVTTAVTQVNFVHNSGNFANGGLVRLYGVS
jgi:hypothetical protein